MKNVFNFKGCQFASFNYTNSHGEVFTYNVILGADYGVAKKADLETLKAASFTEQGLEEARIRLITALEKNLDPKTQSNQSKAQQDAYISLEKGMRLHKEKGTINILCRVIKKTQTEAQKEETKANIESGNFNPKKKTNKRQTTIDQDEVKKVLDLKERQIRQFNFSAEKMKQAKVNGETLTF